jgi:glutamate synthase (NADPH/NADH) small chain
MVNNYIGKHVIDDAQRCLQCKNPQCRVGCPVNTPIREAIHLLLENKIVQAGELLFKNNPLSLVCGHVCPQENRCEGHCILGKKSLPVHVSAIERYISDYYMNVYKPTPSRKTAGKIAIIGSGPSGITIAFYLAQRDFDVTIFEGNDQIGGILRYGVPEFRLPKRILDRMMEVMIASGIRIRPNTLIGANLVLDDLLNDGFNAVFVGTGVWQPQKLGIRGESFGHVHYAIEYLRNPEVYRLGKKVAVIGTGNVAMDVARTALRHRCEEVYIISRLGEDSVRARNIDMQYAQIDGAQILFYKSPVEFTDEGIILADSQVVTDNKGRETAKPIPGTERLFPVDSAIIAIGQGPRAVIVSSTTGLDLTEDGLLAVDECGRTSKAGVFASGDVVTGAKTVAEAVYSSRRVAEAMMEYVESIKK